MENKKPNCPALFDYLPQQHILAAYQKSPGNELLSGKFFSPESSAVLVANAFGLFVEHPDLLPPIPNTPGFGWPAERVALEECARFPWRGGEHPWLDVVIETNSFLIGMESKRYEPFRRGNSVYFSEAYRRPVWGRAMKPFEALRDGLTDGSVTFERLDAAQLVKHAFGLRTEAQRRGKSPALIYLFAEPTAWPDGRPVSMHAKQAHEADVQKFSSLAMGGEVEFGMCTYRELLSAFLDADNPLVQNHADNLRKAFDV